MLSWSPIEGAFAVAGSRSSAIDTFWRMVHEDDRTPVRRKLVIALVDHIRENHERTGQLAPAPDHKQASPLTSTPAAGEAAGVDHPPVTGATAPARVTGGHHGSAGSAGSAA